MSVVRSPAELEPTERAVAIGTFDGVHRGHRAAIEAAKAAGLRSTVVTFDPHPRLVLGYDVQLLTTLRRRVELIEEAGPDDILVVEFTEALSRLEPEEFVARILEPIGTKAVVAAETFRFGRGTEGRRRAPPPSRARGHRRAARRRRVVEPDPRARRRGGDARGRRPPRPAARARRDGRYRATSAAARSGSRPRTSRSSRISSCLHTGSTRARRSVGSAAISIGVNPHYGGSERRIEAFLLDFEGDLYGKELGIELWERLRDERAFASEDELVRQIALDVEATRASTRPS